MPLIYQCRMLLKALLIRAQVVMKDKHLFLGGARSGKSALAETDVYAWLQAHPSGRVIYVATAQVWDEEMRDRVELHRQRRPETWQLIEEPMQLAALLDRYGQQQSNDQPICIMVDCLTLWLTNQLCQVDVDDDTAAVAHAAEKASRAIAKLLEAVKRFSGALVMVSNEVGSGIVPLGKLSRQFQDLSGTMNQRLAQECDKVTLAVAGLPVKVKE